MSRTDAKELTLQAGSVLKTGVLFIQSATVPPLGADIWVHALIMRHLDRARFRVYAACTPGKKGARTPAFEALSDVPDLTIRPINLGRELFLSSPLSRLAKSWELAPAAWHLTRLAAYVRREQISILHTSDRPRDALACVLLGRLTGAKSVIQVHVKYDESLSPVLRWAIASADARVGVSQFVTDTLVKAGHRAKTGAVLNAVDIDRWNPAIDPNGIRAELGIDPGAPLVTTVARIFPGKGQAELIRAVAKLAKEIPALRLLIVGQDYPIGTHHSTELQALAVSLRVEKHIQFTGQRRDVDRILAASDVFAMPSDGEPFGLVFAEAMAMRKPVIALASGGAPEVIEDGKSGLLSPLGDIDALANNLRTLLRDPSLRARMGERGRAIVENRFTPKRQAREIEALYQSL